MTTRAKLVVWATAVVVVSIWAVGLSVAAGWLLADETGLSELDVAAFEEQVASDLNERLQLEFPDVQIDGIDCSEIAFPDEGEAIETCVGQIDGQDLRVVATVNEDEQVARVQLLDRIVDAEMVEALIAEQLVADLSIPTGIDCGYTLAVVPINEVLDCTAVDSRGVMRPLEIRLLPNGELTIQLG